MATDPTVINDGTDNKSYSLISLTEREALWRDSATDLVEPSSLRVSQEWNKLSAYITANFAALYDGFMP